jgi:hypothetical protein
MVCRIDLLATLSRERIVSYVGLHAVLGGRLRLSVKVVLPGRKEFRLLAVYSRYVATGMTLPCSVLSREWSVWQQSALVLLF